MKSTLIASVAYLLLFLFVTPVVAQGLNWRAVWEWSLPKKSESDLVRIADQAQALGFNVIMMSPPPQLIGFMHEECARRDMRLYLSTVFSGGEKVWRQVMTLEEQARLAEPQAEEYMIGGEPVLPGEVFRSALPCYNRPEVREYFRKRVVANAQLPVDGLAFDYVGYENYRRCYCPVCELTLAAYSAEHPGTDLKRAEAIVFEDIMLRFINEMAEAAREANPQISLTIHVYPWYAPNPYYGHRTDIDFVGETVSWFFKPHWPLAKVKARTDNLVRVQHACYPQHHAAPFIGFDASKARDYRSARRVAQELEIIKSSGASALHIAELGYLLDKPLVAAAVARELGGTYRAEARD